MSAISATNSLSSIGEKSPSIKEGYKKTKLGWIPEEWEIKSLDDIGDFSKGKGISKMEISSSGKPCIRYAEIYTKYDFYTEHLESYVSEESALNSREISYGDLLFAGSGETLEDIGKCVAYLGKEDAFAGGDIVILSPKNEDARYLSFLLNHSVANGQKYKLGQGHSVVHIYSSGLKKLKVPLPPIKEQQKIATILSTWDSAIAKQEQLITAKQEFKKGLMQLLLTGKKRFEGFEGEWESKTLNECCNIKGKYGINAAAVPYKTDLPRYLRITDIDDSGNYSPEKEVSVDDPTWSEYVLEDGDIVFARTGNTTGKTYLYDSADGELVFAGFLIKFKPDPRKLNPYFLKYFTNSTAYWKWVEVMSVRSGQPGINSNEYGKLNIKLPSLTEQQKIASVLSAADKEIGLLQSELATLREQKRGLMQRLLTGEVRVEIN